MRLDGTSHVEQRDERLVGGLDEHELERVAVESDALQSIEDRGEHGTASN